MLRWKDFLRLSAHIQLMPVLESGEETLVGGQAVMEGVMMRAPHSYCVAVRRADGTIVTEESPLAKLSDRYPVLRLPILRGVATLGQAMSLGMKALRFSANTALAEEGKPPQVTSGMMALQMVFSLGFFIVLYKLVPLYLATLLGTWVPQLGGRFAMNMTDGVIRMGIFLLFLAGVARMKDIRRVFEYHGAEHKVVFNFESGQPVSVANAQRFTTLHPRCGTSFLLVVMTVSLVVYALLPFDSFAAKLGARIALLPVVAGVSYEMIRYAARKQGSLMALLTAPGLWLQRITTQPPDDSQAEVAIRALDGAMALEEKQGGQLVIA